MHKVFLGLVWFSMLDCHGILNGLLHGFGSSVENILSMIIEKQEESLT
jgi:hypothetical protein